MNPFWLTVWLSSSGLLPSATTYDFQATVNNIFTKGHAIAVFNSTTVISNFISNLGDLESSYQFVTPSQKRVFRVTEQNLVLDSKGKPIAFGSKFLAPIQWIMTATQDPAYGSIVNAPFMNSDYLLSNDSTTLVKYTIINSSFTKCRYRIYRGDEYAVQDNYSFTFKKKP